MLYAVIDTGYNSTRLCLYQVFPNETFRIIGSTKSFLRLGEGLKEGYPISEEKVKEAEALFRGFRRVIEKKKVEEVKLLGTSAFRYASNGQEVAKRLSEAVGVEMRVLSGEEEGRLSFLGTVNSLPIDSGVVFDLGGGSLEVVYFSSREVKEVYHFRLGALRLSREIKDEKELRKKVRSELSVLKKVDGPLIGAGGNVRALGKMDLKLSAFPLKSTHGYELHAKEVSKYSNVLFNLDPEERANLPGISRERAYTVATASVVVDELLKAVGAEKVVISAFGLREGALLEKRLDNLRERWLESFAYWFNVDPPWDLYRHFVDLYQKVTAFILSVMKSAGFLDPYEMCQKFVKYSTLPGFTSREVLMVYLMCKAAKGKLKKKNLSVLKGQVDKDELVKKAKEVKEAVESSVAGSL